MSLLMDALKKAEEEKKRAAGQLKAGDQQSEDIIETGEEIISAEEADKAETSTESAELTLTPLSDQRDDNTTDPVTAYDDTPDTDIPEQAEMSATDDVESFIEEDIISQEVFEESEGQSSPLYDEEPVAAVSEEPLVEGSTSEFRHNVFQPTPVAAQTIFTASGVKKTNNNIVVWAVFLTVVVLFTVAFSAFYYFTTMPVAISFPPPLTTREVVQSTPVTPVHLETLITGTTGTDDDVGYEQEIEEETIAVTTEVPESESLSSSRETAPTTEYPEESEMAPAITVEDIVDSARDQQVEIVEEEQLLLERDDIIPENTLQPLFVVAEEMMLRPSQAFIKISKNKPPEEHNTTLKEAFKAYHAGQFHASKSLYQSALKDEPNNRDAHLGLAAIAINNNDRASAYGHYAVLLKLDPTDVLALNGLISLSESIDPVADESAIKILLRREGDPPFLYFSLGNLYAKQARWVDAQQAFSNAYRRDTSNSEYAVNLAISFDRLGQYSAALDYYKIAMVLVAKKGGARFDIMAVEKRIIALDKISRSAS